MLTPCGASTPVLTTLYSFPGQAPAPYLPPDGAFPEAGLVLNSSGQLFGTTYAGGSGWGTVFELMPPTESGGAWTISQIYAFSGGSDGANPRASLVFSPRGVLFGTTEQGGANGYGTVFSLTPTGNGNWSQAVIYSFKGGQSDGANPEAGLILTSKGVLYGTTEAGGTTGNGTVFSLTPATGGAWTEVVLYSFAGAPFACGTAGQPACDGANPMGSLTMSKTGTLYGTTYSGGTANWGTVFSLTPSSGNSWTYALLYSFIGAASGAGTTPPPTCGTSGQPVCDGGAPAGNVVVNSTTGALYGTTTLGGKPAGCPQGGYEQGCGAIFELTPPVISGNPWTETLLYSFTGSPQDGMLPSYNIALPSPAGGLYGTTFTGGSSTDICFPGSYLGCGIVFVLRPPKAPSTTWTKSDLGVFEGDNCASSASGCGGGPTGVIISPSGGILYGTTYVGGLAGGYGTVFELTF